MKQSSVALIVLHMIGVMSGVSPIQAQPLSATTPDAILRTRTAIQAVTNDLNSALLRGDATNALQFLASDFELGHHQYRKRDAAWMRQVLPKQLELAQFTKLTAAVSSVELNGRQAIVRGRMDARASLKEGQPGANLSGSYGAVWVETEAGWRLKREDGPFNMLLQLTLVAEPPASTSPFNTSVEKASPPRDDPALVLEQSHMAPVGPLVFAPDGSVLATFGFYGRLRFSSARTGAFLKAMPTPMTINSMTYAPDGTLVTGHNDGIVRLWDVQKGTLKRELSVSRWSVYAVCVSPDGRTLAADGAGSVQLWDIASGRKVQTLGQTGGNVYTLDFSPDSMTLAFVGREGVELWNMKDGKLVHAIKYEQWAGFLPDGKMMVTITNGRLRFRGVQSGAVEREVAIPDPLRKPRQSSGGNIPVISGFVYSPGAMLAPNGRIAASIYADGSIGLWDTQNGSLQRVLRGFQSDVMGGDVSKLAFSPDNEALAVGSRNGETAVWNVLPSKLSNPIPEK